MQYDLVFEGGGAKGSVFVGALQEFFAREHTARRFIRTSAGAPPPSWPRAMGLRKCWKQLMRNCQTENPSCAACCHDFDKALKSALPEGFEH